MLLYSKEGRHFHQKWQKMSHFSKINFFLKPLSFDQIPLSGGRERPKEGRKQKKIVYAVFQVSWHMTLFSVYSLICIIWFMQPVKKLHGFARSERMLMDLANE